MAKVAKTKNSGTYKNLVGATNHVNNLSNLVNQFVPIYQTICDTVDNPNKISNIYQLLDNITEELIANGNECELEFMANNKFILTTYTGNGNCIINVLPGGANINCSVGICGTAKLRYTDRYSFY